ncbi:MAG TPA: discoidin domain-containing protein [Sedimentisphaerales bacterium]|nr:discoidin domain-containing protein [Sedimentisphaerales bacterium]HOC65651.1 discoidin domain-containing protein [Sedimentisphaerales bacterium]HOH66156.1 discoidin domain-containing protein [Sedimentisphaerales bacterium]
MFRKCMWLTAAVLVSLAFAGPAHGQSVKINFQLGTAVTPEGYLPDSGLAYGDRGNGWTYGWSRDITADARERNNVASPDKRWDTLVHLEKGADAVWEIAIENGEYNLYIVAGDPDNTDQTNTFDVEGVIITDTNGQVGNFDEFTLTVTVADGRLTLQPAAGSSNSKICFIDIILAIAPEAARSPSPAKEAADVPRDVVMSWVPGEGVSGHDVYFGTDLDAVSNASRANPMGVLVSQDQAAATFDPTGLLEFVTTYYWRIDEVLTAGGVFKGDVWSFTTEPFAYAVQNIIATASSSGESAGPENTINGSGLNEADGHSIESTDMWLTASDAEQPAWIQYEFDRVYKMYQLLVWNYNVQFEPVLGFGAKDVTVEYSSNGEEWTALGDVEFAEAAAAENYAANTTVDMAGVPAKYVRLTINDNWGMLTQIGLSEVRFLYIPAHPREPQPAAGAADVTVDSILSWRAGRDATSHDVYFGTNQEELPLAGSPAQAAFTPSTLEFGMTYYWKVDEVADDGVWAGELWSFSTQEYALVDGFEDYTDDIEAGEAIFDTWVDGWVNQTGATVGYINAPFAERTIVHGGKQSMPLQYDNSGSPFYSETTRVFDAAQDWSGNGANTLVLYFQGVPGPFMELAGGKIVMGAAGTDIWNTTDEFRFACKPLSGDGSIVALVESVSRAVDWTKAGVMIRETLEAGSPFAAVYATPDYGCRYQARLTADVAAVSDSGVVTTEQTALVAPYWVKIERVGNAFNGYYSTDGENWTAMAWNPQTIAMGANVYIGLAITSHSAGVLASAEFSGVATTGNVNGAWAVETIGGDHPEGNGAAQLYVTLEDATGKSATVTHPAGNGAVFLAGWNEWAIPYSDLAGVNLARIEAMTIGVGNRTSPAAGGSGIVYIDDIGFGRPAAQ